jgi:hypothetical protein
VKGVVAGDSFIHRDAMFPTNAECYRGQNLLMARLAALFGVPIFLRAPDQRDGSRSRFPNVIQNGLSHA